ncbi:MAG TPA: DNA double-strand break repair nuclease NurA [Chloroflexia bacterium]|nr:DNA double-strand break repair nuclease NurA [Chloroflexia bacterium]
MPYDHTEIARQIAATLGQAQTAQTTRAEAALDAAEIYQATEHDHWCTTVEQVRSRRLMGLPQTPLHEFTPVAPAAADYTVVATDSSYVPADKHRGAYCYMINVGRVMVQYGDEPAAELDSTPTHCVDPLLEGDEGLGSGKLLQAQCALQELTELHHWAEQFGADLALVDGSLMQMSLAIQTDESVQKLMDAYGEVLSDFERLRVPVVGYVSKPASEMVVRATRLLACRRAHESGLGAACEQRCGRQECSGLWTLDDSSLFWELLPDGYRSPVFRAHSPWGVHAAKGLGQDMGFCYLATPYEVARLEFPLWVLESGGIDRVQSIALSQCLLGEGYPKVLTLAHNFAVLRNEDRESYFFLLERAGLIAPPSEKARGKRVTGGRI